MDYNQKKLDNTTNTTIRYIIGGTPNCPLTQWSQIWGNEPKPLLLLNGAKKLVVFDFFLHEIASGFGQKKHLRNLA